MAITPTCSIVFINSICSSNVCTLLFKRSTSEENSILRDSSLDCFKTKLPTTKNPDGATEIRVDNDKVIISWSLCSNIELETKDRRNHWPRWLANCRD